MTSPHAIMGSTHRWRAGGPADCWAKKKRRVNTLSRGQKGCFQNSQVILAPRCITIGKGQRKKTTAIRNSMGSIRTRALSQKPWKQREQAGYRFRCFQNLQSSIKQENAGPSQIFVTSAKNRITVYNVIV